MVKIKEYLWKFNFHSFALGFVFFVFGVWQILSPGYWSAYLPKYFSFLDPEKFFIINGIFNFVVGLALIFNFYPLFLSVGIFINSLKEMVKEKKMKFGSLNF
jgi:uncharacterized protein YjeT (DUF2065 family)